MDPSTTRRGLLATLIGGGAGAAAVSPASQLLDRFAPLSGTAWQSTQRGLPTTVDGGYGPATITYDDRHVPHVEAETEPPAYFAIGYIQAADRLFEMDLIRRRMRGTLSAALGTTTLESDRFHAKMDFLGSAQASARALEGTEAKQMLSAYAAGVNHYIGTSALPLEFGLVGYEPKSWSIVDSLLVGTQVSWGLTGSFRPLRRHLLRDRLDPQYYTDLYPAEFDHGSPIIRDQQSGTVLGRAESNQNDRDTDDGGTRLSADFVNWLSRHEPPTHWGSNSWVIGGQHTESGSPIVANDMHLTLMAPPVWYEQRIAAGDVDVRGVALPGIPFVIAGENDAGAWGFTNSNADVVDHYTYDLDSNRERYRYQGNWRHFETTERTLQVAGATDQSVEIKRTKHGVFIERTLAGETNTVGVAWTGMTGTREAQAFLELSRSSDRTEVREAIRDFEVPTQNLVYADREGGTLYQMTGEIPIREIDGTVVTGDRLFNGSTGAGEWSGFEPFGESTWDGFVPFEEKPAVIDPDYLATANQRILDTPIYPIGNEYASGFRGRRLYERLDSAVEAGRAIDREFVKNLQRDTLDDRARELVPAILQARERMPSRTEPYLDELAEWNYRMDRRSTAALVFRWFYEFFKAETFEDTFAAVDLGENFWPEDWPFVTLSPTHELFDGDRAAVMATAMGKAIDHIENQEWETYADFNRTAIDHPFGEQVSALNYPRYPTDGSPFTIMNFRKMAGHGSSQRSIYTLDGDSITVLPGGQNGSYFSDHYQDQLRTWADGEYYRMPRAIEGEPDVQFLEDAE